MDMDGVINQQASVSQLLGISPAGSRLAGYEGASLPASTYSGPDNAAVPWSPDSSVFWLAVVAGLTVAGLIVASADRGGGVAAGVRIGRHKLQGAAS